MERTAKITQARYAIEDVLYRYAEAIDSGRLEDLGPLLAECALQMPDGETLVGSAAIVERYRNIILFYDEHSRHVAYEYGVSTPRTRHLIGNTIFEFDNEVTCADVRSVFTVCQNLDRHTEVVAGGRYLDRFERTIAGWRLKKRGVFIDHPGNLSGHVHLSID